MNYIKRILSITFFIGLGWINIIFAAGEISNPFGSQSLTSLAEALINGLLYMSPFVIVPLLIYAGFMFVTAVGDVEKLKKAKLILLYVILGAALIFGAKAILSALQGTLEKII